MTDQSYKSEFSSSFENRQSPMMDEETIAAERRALRVLRDSFHLEKETLLEESLDDMNTRRNVGRFIGYTMVKPYWE